MIGYKSVVFLLVKAQKTELPPRVMSIFVTKASEKRSSYNILIILSTYLIINGLLTYRT